MKIILLGDSITQGLGSKKINFHQELKRLLDSGDDVINMAMTGTTIDYVNTIYSDILAENPDYVVILYGNVDAMLKPSRTGKVFCHLPKRFKMNDGAMLLPRPFYSHSMLKSIGQHIENCFRTIFRNIVIMVDGTEQWMPLNQYVEHYKNICDDLRKQGIRIVICSTVYIDDKYFNGTNNEYICYNKWLKDYTDNNGYIFIDLYHMFETLIKKDGWDKYYNKDHFHPNGEGYALMAAQIANVFPNRCVEDRKQETGYEKDHAKSHIILHKS